MPNVTVDNTSVSSEFAEQVLTRISLALLNSDISGRELCKQLGVSHNWLNKRLAGDQSPTLHDLERIAGVLKVSVTDLLGCRQSSAKHPEAKDLDDVLGDRLVEQSDKDRILGIVGEMILWAYQRSGQAPAPRGRAATPPRGRASVKTPARRSRG